MRDVWKHIEGHFRWPELYRRAVRLAQDDGCLVEVGCYKGKSTAFLAGEALDSGKDLNVVAVDLWEKNPKGLICTYAEFKLNVLYFSNVKPLQMFSHQAATLFNDESVDFVFLDADHSYEAVLRDIQSWWPKLKPGGWMAGDDLIHGGVRRAVQDCFGAECMPGKNSEGKWARFQSLSIPVLPNGGGWCWYTERKR